MAKPTGGLLAFDARGTVGKTIVFSSWRGRSYVRRHVVPANPRTAAQTTTRTLFSWLQQTWKLAPTSFQAVWTAYAKGLVVTDRNAFTKFNLLSVGTDVDLANFIFSPGAKGGLAAATNVVTPAATQLTLDATAPAAPTGWSVLQMNFAIIRDQDPQTEILYAITGATDLTDPYQAVFTGLQAATLYRTSAWPTWTKPDGSLAYGPGLNTDGTTP